MERDATGNLKHRSPEKRQQGSLAAHAANDASRRAGNKTCHTLLHHCGKGRLNIGFGAYIERD